jgi:hypothetical protein
MSKVNLLSGGSERRTGTMTAMKVSMRFMKEAVTVGGSSISWMQDIVTRNMPDSAHGLPFKLIRLLLSEKAYCRSPIIGNMISLLPSFIKFKSREGKRRRLADNVPQLLKHLNLPNKHSWYWDALKELT